MLGEYPFNSCIETSSLKQIFDAFADEILCNVVQCLLTFLLSDCFNHVGDKFEVEVISRLDTCFESS